MIDLYYDTTPNGRKIHIALEELGLPYEVKWINVKNGEQFSPEYVRINPNSKIPAIVDHDGPDGEEIAIFESAAILLYLAEKTGLLLPTEPGPRWEVICWTIWQVANQGPASGNASHFMQYAPAAGIVDEYAQERYVGETRRCCELLNERLTSSSYIAGGDFSIADIACFPWTRVLKAYGIALDDYPSLAEWSNRIAARDSARSKLERPADASQPPEVLTGAAYTKLFGVAATDHTP